MRSHISYRKRDSRVHSLILLIETLSKSLFPSCVLLIILYHPSSYLGYITYLQYNYYYNTPYRRDRINSNTKIRTFHVESCKIRFQLYILGGGGCFCNKLFRYTYVCNRGTRENWYDIQIDFPFSKLLLNYFIEFEHLMKLHILFCNASTKLPFIS